MQHNPARPLIAIACGGTGGHLFPGMAVGHELVIRGCDVTLMISRKDVDQQAVKSVTNMAVVRLPSVGLGGWNIFPFAAAFWKSFRMSSESFTARVPAAVLGMGGFTSAPPILAANKLRVPTFIHDSNTIPGRANRWLAPRVKAAFIYFQETSARLKNANVSVTGMPVRPQFRQMDAGACRAELGLDPRRPVLLVMGGSQGARGINDLVRSALFNLSTMAPQLQFLHVTGREDYDVVRAAYESHRIKAVVHPFFDRMEVALGAATAAISRAGASSIAELAAMQVPAVLVPYPFAADNHQLQNARAFVEAGAGRLLEQGTARAEELVWVVLELLCNPRTRSAMTNALQRWHHPNAAAAVASGVLFGAGLEDAGKKTTALPIQTSDKVARP